MFWNVDLGMGGMHCCWKRGCGGFDACDDYAGNDDCWCSNAAMTLLFEFDRPMLSGKLRPEKFPLKTYEDIWVLECFLLAVCTSPHVDVHLFFLGFTTFISQISSASLVSLKERGDWLKNFVDIPISLSCRNGKLGSILRRLMVWMLCRMKNYNLSYSHRNSW